MNFSLISLCHWKCSNTK